MILKLYSIKDTKIGGYYPPQAYYNKLHALRSFSSEVFANKQTTFGKFPADFEIFEVGEFDDSSGLLGATQHVNIANGNDLVPQAMKGSE